MNVPHVTVRGSVWRPRAWGIAYLALVGLLIASALTAAHLDPDGLMPLTLVLFEAMFVISLPTGVVIYPVGILISVLGVVGGIQWMPISVTPGWVACATAISAYVNVVLARSVARNLGTPSGTPGFPQWTQRNRSHDLT